MKELLENIIKGIVKNPELVKIVEYTNDDEIVFEIHVDPQDVGQIIGKDGRTIKSINTLLTAAKKDENTKFLLKVIR
ncbi:KH domain-containing protein [Marinitoga lauensis]|uniref:KH domain-containing protein n=1 Tax=Marinitoga lauensis TaxID=2201189 RepID=UPI001011C869|nr:KH domain-containing protein [Marinitoga lauensis]